MLDRQLNQLQRTNQYFKVSHRIGKDRCTSAFRRDAQSLLASQLNLTSTNRINIVN